MAAPSVDKLVESFENPSIPLGIGPGRLSGQGSKEAHGETASPREGWWVVLPITGGGDEGGSNCSDLDLNTPEAEHGHTIYCDAADSGPV